jgi:hypothetical protein
VASDGGRDLGVDVGSATIADGKALSLNGSRLSSCYVTGMGPADGATAAGGCLVLAILWMTCTCSERIVQHLDSHFSRTQRTIGA